MKCKNILLLTAVVCIFNVSACIRVHAYSRPNIDKSQYKGTVWSAANPWWAPNKSRTHGGGGPDFAWQKFSDDPVKMWKQVAERYKSYGLTGLQMEMITNNGYVDVFENMLKGFEEAGNGFMGQPFLTDQGGGYEQTKKNYLKLFSRIGPLLKEHPNVFRIEGSPVVVLYTPHTRKPSEWRDIINSVEAVHGHMIWLMNSYMGFNKNSILDYINEFDGVTMYANWSTSMQEEFFAWLVPIMKKSYPNKIFEAAVHTTYCVHFHYGGVSPRLTDKYRKSWDMTISSDPDSITITNWFDTYENSRIMPSYELDDSMLKIAQYNIEKWKKGSFVKFEEPVLYVFNYVSQRLGNKLDFEVIGFPTVDKYAEIAYSLQVCDENGQLIHEFPVQKLTLDRMRSVVFDLDTIGLGNYKAVFPRIKYVSAGLVKDSGLLPPTYLVTSIRPHLLFWGRATNHVLQIDTDRTWFLNGKRQGETVVWTSGSHVGVIKSLAFSQGVSGVENRGGGWVRVLRNGREIESFAKWDLSFCRFINMPDPGDAVDWYNLELENWKGNRYISPPIWVSKKTRGGLVTMPVYTYDNQIANVVVDKERVPFFQYKCDRDTGRLLQDTSGYQHHGCLAQKHLSRTGYRHEHLGNASAKDDAASPVWKSENDDMFLYFDGNDYAMIQGGTAFPYASTYEITIKPDDVDSDQTVLASPNGQIFLRVLKGGIVEVGRKQASESEGGASPENMQDSTVRLHSKDKILSGVWTNVQVVYDLQKMFLYINGNLQDSMQLRPTRSAEVINHIVIGGGAKFPYDALPSYKGGLRNIRIYGRNLEVNEFIN